MLVAALGLMFLCVALAIWVGTMASAPLKTTLIQSDLAFEDLGTGDVILDHRRWSEDVAKAMLAASGGWTAALRPATLATIAIIMLVAFGYGRIVKSLEGRRGWVLLAILGGSIAAIASFRLLSYSETTASYWSYSASTRASTMVGWPVGAATIALCAAALTIGVAVPRRSRCEEPPWLIEPDASLPGSPRPTDWMDTGPFG